MVSGILFRLDVDDRSLDRLAAILDDGERARAAAFRFAIDRDRFIARRGQLRLFLADLTGASPSAIRFAVGAHGKPVLVGSDALHFSASSAGSLGLCVTCGDGPIGCDLAKDEDVPSHLAIARRLFAPTESAYLARLAPSARPRAFVELWTRKEAFLKAIGHGLDHPLDTFDVVAGSDVRWVLHGVSETWRVEPLSVEEGYVAAMAVRDNGPSALAKLNLSLYLADKLASSLAPFGEPQPVQASHPGLAA